MTSRAYALMDILASLLLISLAMTLIFRFHHHLERDLYRSPEPRNQARFAAWALTHGASLPRDWSGSVTPLSQHRQVWQVEVEGTVFFVLPPEGTRLPLADQPPDLFPPLPEHMPNPEDNPSSSQ